MSDRWIKIRGGGRIRINPGWGSPPSQRQPGPALPSRGPSRPDDAGDDTGRIMLETTVIERAEMVTEAVFRPGADDVEVSYVMSGRQHNRLDRLHGLASDRVVMDATPVSVESDVESMIELLKRDGLDGARMIVKVHTHPSGIAKPSDTDTETWSGWALRLRDAFPTAEVLFGVHAVSRQAPEFLERNVPSNVGPGNIAWRSNTRDHELALFNPDGSPHEVRAVG